MNNSCNAFVGDIHHGNHSALIAPVERKLRVVLSSVSSDSHTWNLVFIQLMLEEMGHEVINLGACTPDELIVQECGRYNPDVLVISSVNGHGHIDGERLVRRLRASSETRDLPAIIGGKLGILGAANVSFTRQLMDAGFNAVFEASAGTESFERYVRQLSFAASAHESVNDTLEAGHDEIR